MPYPETPLDLPSPSTTTFPPMSESPLPGSAPAPQAQGEFPLSSSVELTALDLFAGIGGLSAGFREAGFTVTGVDKEPVAKLVFESAAFGRGVTWDLSREIYVQQASIVLGGPPCRPWSAVNQQRRRTAHDDHGLLEQFFRNALEVRPAVILLENVPALGSDSSYLAGVALLRAEGYDTARAIIRYNEFGAATRRKRLFTLAVRNGYFGAKTFFKLLEARKQAAQTVGQAIRWLRDKSRGEVADHDWSELLSIGNYRHLYASGKYGWKKLSYEEPAPSFGSVAKTYILHPEAGVGSYPERVLSVREVMTIRGFDLTVAFPAGTSRSKRYQMVANTVSPLVSREMAVLVRQLLAGT
jgi:DNA (cytosine-5)-methyltransferase 1